MLFSTKFGGSMSDAPRSARTSRRNVLKYGAAAAAVGAAGAFLIDPLARAAEEPIASPSPASATAFHVALISDTHLGKDGEKPSQQMKDAVAEINASPAELIIHCGDLVNAGEIAANEKRYPEFLEIAKGFEKPWHAVPGNHDPLAMFTKHIRRETDFVIDRDPWRFICFRDALANPAHDGAVDAGQVRWIQNRIDEAAARSQRVFLVSHVTHHETHAPESGWMIKAGRREFDAMLEKSGASIAAFFAGHMHTGLRGWSDTAGRIHEIVLPSNCWNFDGQKMKNAPGFAFTEDRPGWVLAKITSSSLTLSYKPIAHDVSVTKELPL
jgi:predicted phosphodiesterase